MLCIGKTSVVKSAFSISQKVEQLTRQDACNQRGRSEGQRSVPGWHRRAAGCGRAESLRDTRERLALGWLRQEASALARLSPNALFAELDLFHCREVLNVDAVRELFIVPVDLGEHRLATEWNQSGYLASGMGNVSSMLPGALQELFAIADRISDLDRLSSLGPLRHIHLTQWFGWV